MTKKFSTDQEAVEKKKKLNKNFYVWLFGQFSGSGLG